MSVTSTPTASQQNLKKKNCSKLLSFIAGVIDTGDQHLLTNISANFRKNYLNGILRGPGETDREKNLKRKSRVRLPLRIADMKDFFQ
jgi:hypothetical protein